MAAPVPTNLLNYWERSPSRSTNCLLTRLLFLRRLRSSGSHKWQKRHAAAFPQRPEWKKAHGAQVPELCPAEPMLGRSGEPGAGPILGGARLC